MKTRLLVKLSKPVKGFWDYGPKDTFIFSAHHFEHGKVEVGSWEANAYKVFYYSKKPTDKQALGWAKPFLKRWAKRLMVDVEFAWVTEN